jgi:hypothetical protein
MRYIYYRIYKALTKVKTNDTPAFNAMILLVTMQAVNILSVFCIINYFYKWVFDKQQVVIGGLFLYIILLIPNYFFLVCKRDEIIKRYENETKEDRLWGTIGLLFYIVVSFVVFIVLGNTIVQKHY